jgi:hypothetical protein
MKISIIGTGYVGLIKGLIRLTSNQKFYINTLEMEIYGILSQTFQRFIILLAIFQSMVLPQK